MEPALGRRLSRLALTIEIALALLMVVALWGDPAWALGYYAFVAVTGTALIAYLVGSARV